MQGSQTVRALERGLQVLHVLQATPLASLHDIHVATAIPKPTLLRILHTLDRAGLVSRRLADGRYRLGAFTGVLRKRDRHDQIAEAAVPVLVGLCEKVKWQADLTVPAGNCMERRETTRALTPFALHKLGRVELPIGLRLGWLISGVGRAYLASCSEREREQILRRLRKSGNPVDRLAHTKKARQDFRGDTPAGLRHARPQLRRGNLRKCLLRRRVGIHGGGAIRWQARLRRDQPSLDQGRIQRGRVRSPSPGNLQGAASEIVSSLRRPRT